MSDVNSSSKRVETAGDPLFLEKPPQYLLRYLLGLVSRFPRWAYTGRAAFLARTDVDSLQAVFKEVFLQVERGGAQPDAAREVVELAMILGKSKNTLGGGRMERRTRPVNRIARARILWSRCAGR